MTSQEIIAKLPYQYPFLFVDNILSVDEESITGTYTYDPGLPFYEGHFKDNPITPGVILTETMAQIGLVALGIFISWSKNESSDNHQIAFTSADVHFYKPVFPGENVMVKGFKVYYRFHKLKCKAEMYNKENKLICKGTLAGMIKKKQ